MKKMLVASGLVLIACMQLEYVEIPVGEISSSSEMSVSSSSESSLQIGKYELLYTGISYYDAILLCNKMSIEEGLDTLYQYDKPVFTEDSLFWLPNIKVLENRSGYRLPTKEEWQQAKENGEIEKFRDDVGEWLYGQSNSMYATFELAPHFVKAVGLYREREDGPVYGMRVIVAGNTISLH
ncbi:MAG: SUMF1/EgtB/PvdO family nonheme iron enzyme [Fibromonadaceae bacterium]|nr:SUMF1/EgtB/PvdO family nonheme iron enzyme [Fibromonadaceae bacterium]